MVYLEHSAAKFWRCEKTAAKTVTISYGKCGSNGRSVTKTDFKSDKEVKDYIRKQEASKRNAGYVDSADPDHSRTPSSRGTKRKKTDTTTKPPPSSKKVGLKHHAAPSLSNDGEEGCLAVDSGVAGVDAALASRARVHANLHAKLALVDPEKNSDKYYILQVLVDEHNKKKKQQQQRGRKKTTASGTGGPDFYLFTRWGRTGTGGQAKLDGPVSDEESVEENFQKIFKSKTGVEWTSAIPGTPPKKNKYEYLKISNAVSDGKWYYYLSNDPLGKPDGWYQYDDKNSAEVEELYAEFEASSNAARLSSRFVHSETSGFTYKVDLADMTQTNTQSGMARPIQRVVNGGKAPTKKPPNSATVASAPPTPLKAVSAKAPTTKSSPKSARSLSKPVSVSAGVVDSAASSKLQQGSVYGDYEVMLNQTNLCWNNNKFYKIQLAETPDGIYLFTKWGRVGEAGATQEVGPMDSDKAIKEFEKKFRSKTGNKWEDRDDFQSNTGKYTIVEMEKDANKADSMSSCANAMSSSTKVLPCKLDAKTKELVDLIFNEDMFKTAMAAMNLDPVKLPLGALSKAQIARGFAALEQLDEELNGRANRNTLMSLTSNFYTIIPHAFGRSAGPVLNTHEMVKEKYDMLNTLTDIETAQSMQKKNKKRAEEAGEEALEHPSDLNYQQLAADLSLVGKKDEARAAIEKYLNDTKGTGYYGGMKLRDIWRVNRHNESARFAAHNGISNRKLLWHGTNVAVVAAILKSGLRIMPHSGGRVGRGIYLADQHAKSAGYVSPARGTAIMFLVEAALGKQHKIRRDDPTLTCAPAGFDSVLAEGTSAPAADVTIDIDNNAVKVPQGKPATLAANSSFYHNEFLIYKESQHRIRYILAFDE